MKRVVWTCIAPHLCSSSDKYDGHCTTPDSPCLYRGYQALVEDKKKLLEERAKQHK